MINSIQSHSILELFDNYTAAFNALDAEAIARCYRFPCAISDADGVQTFTNTTELVAKFRANCVIMKARKYEKASYHVIGEQRLDKQQYAMTIRWQLVIDGQELAFNALYLCHCISGQWFIFSANVY